MRFLLATLSAIFYSSLVANASNLRGDEINIKGIEKEEPRKLKWIWVPDGTVINNDIFYDNRSEKWWNDARIIGGATDPEDFLRNTDLCFNQYDGTFSRENCPSPPDCNWSGQEGEAKLCINRVPFANDHSQFYVLMMKCTPTYINCDKCMCGSTSSDTNPDAYCNYLNQDPSDDQTDINCDDLAYLQMITRDGREFSFSPHYY